MSGSTRMAAFALAALSVFAPFTRAAAQVAAPSNDNRAQQTQQLEPQTQLTQREKALSEIFNREVRDVSIVMMDRDWFQLNLALSQTASLDTEGRSKLISDFIEKRTGKHIDADRLADIVDAITSAGGFTLPQDTGPTEGLGPDGACIVFGQFADLDADSYARMLAGMNDAFHPGLRGRNMINVPSLETFSKWVDYHEAGHCMYEGAQQGTYESLDDYVLHRHKSEMYGDVMAALLLARNDGVTDFAETAARLRLVSGALNGPAAARMAPPGSFKHYTAFMYTIHDGLRDAQREIDARGVRGLRSMSMDDIRGLANRIVERNALDSKKSVMIRMMEGNLYDTAQMDQLRRNDPSYEEAYQYALRLRDEMNRVLLQVIDMRGMDATRTPLQQVGFNFFALLAAPAQPTAAERQLQVQTVNMLRDRLIQQAGGRGRATHESLNRAFSQQKDALRQTLRDGTKEQRQEAMRQLPLMEHAIRLAVIEVDGVRPLPLPVFTLQPPPPQATPPAPGPR